MFDVKSEITGGINAIKLNIISSNDNLYESVDSYIKQAINKVVPYFIISIISITTIFIILLLINNPPKIPDIKLPKLSKTPDFSPQIETVKLP